MKFEFLMYAYVVSIVCCACIVKFKVTPKPVKGKQPETVPPSRYCKLCFIVFLSLYIIF